MSTTRTVVTARGPARLHADGAGEALLVLGHGAGGGPDAPDLLSARDAALRCGWRVVRVEQPWRVAGRRVAEAPRFLDEAWLDVLGSLSWPGPLVVGGRSSGARVACRTAQTTGAAAVLALAFPLQPARGPSRLPELLAPDVPRLVVQGARDGFGVPPPCPGVRLELVDGADHAFAVRRMDRRSSQEVLAQVGAAVQRFLQTVT